ncbi:hypothetical protein EDEG_04253, partial [Edhazardia aedis USNM 41457]
KPLNCISNGNNIKDNINKINSHKLFQNASSSPINPICSIIKFTQIQRLIIPEDPIWTDYEHNEFLKLVKSKNFSQISNILKKNMKNVVLYYYRQKKFVKKREEEEVSN